MRIFNGRYFLFAAALLAVWLMGRSRSAQPSLDASWTNVVVDDLENVVSSVEDEPVAVCQQETACSDELESSSEIAAQLLPNEEQTLEDELAFEQLLPSSDVANSDNGEVIEASIVPESYVEPDSVESTTQLTQVEQGAQLADVQPLNPADSETMIDSSQRIDNKFIADVGNQPLQDATPGAWQTNPYVAGHADVQMDDAPQKRTMPASFERNSNSVLDESGQSLQATFPEPDFSQIEYGREDITPLNDTLPDSVAQEAAHHVEYGKSLSRRGATYGARQEFFGALGVIARGNDLQTGGNAHTTALSRAMRALREVQDFAVRNAETQIGMNVSEILETHQTHIISANEAAIMTPVEAMQRYFTFAHQQLDFAGGSNVVVAEALFCLGKLHTVMAKHQPETLDVAQAIVFHRAALSSDAQNYRSFNELGVLLARSGQLTEAESLFKKSLQIRPAPETWQNLAKTHDRQGEVGLAQLAQTEFSIAAQTELIQSPSTQITWLPQQAFNQVGPADFHESSTATAAAATGNVVPASRTAALVDDTDDTESEKKTFAERFNLKKWF